MSAKYFFFIADGDLELQRHWGNDLTLPQARLYTCPGMYVSRGESIYLSPCLTLSKKRDMLAGVP